MTDSLRDRIAAALDASYMSSAGRNYSDWLNNAADAVIAAINERYIIVDPLTQTPGGDVTWVAPGEIDKMLTEGQRKLRQAQRDLTQWGLENQPDE